MDFHNSYVIIYSPYCTYCILPDYNQISKYTLLFSVKYTLKYIPDCTWLYTAIQNYMHIQISSYNFRMYKLLLLFKSTSMFIPKYTPQYALNHPPDHNSCYFFSRLDSVGGSPLIATTVLVIAIWIHLTELLSVWSSDMPYTNSCHHQEAHHVSMSEITHQSLDNWICKHHCSVDCLLLM